MKKKELTIEQELNRELKKGKTKGLGLFEAIHMNFLGKRDGKTGMPKVNGDNEWVSCVMNKEKNAYEEYCSGKWGRISEALKDTYKKCGVLKKEILLLGEKLEIARENEKNTVPVTTVSRKRGEENLSDSQVAARRKREEARRMSAIHAEVARLENELSEKYLELADLQHYAEEITKVVRMLCERVMMHTNQRLDIYWRAVLRVHPERAKMPMTVKELSGISRGEQTYLKDHGEDEKAIEYVLTKFEKEVTDINLRGVEKKEEVA